MNQPWSSTLVSGRALIEGDDFEKKEGKNRVAPPAMSRHAGSTSLDSQRRWPLSAKLAAGRAYGVVGGFRADGFRSLPPAPPSTPPYSPDDGVGWASPSISLSDTIGCSHSLSLSLTVERAFWLVFSVFFYIFYFYRFRWEAEIWVYNLTKKSEKKPRFNEWDHQIKTDQTRFSHVGQLDSASTNENFWKLWKEKIQRVANWFDRFWDNFSHSLAYQTAPMSSSNLFVDSDRIVWLHI